MTKKSYKAHWYFQVLDPKDYALKFENLFPPEFRLTNKNWPGHVSTNLFISTLILASSLFRPQ